MKLFLKGNGDKNIRDNLITLSNILRFIIGKNGIISYKVLGLEQNVSETRECVKTLGIR